MVSNKWHKRFIELAKFISDWSKDPSTKVGAVITEGNRIVSVGFNGFAAGVKDSECRYTNRAIKYPIILHAEENAILFAKRDLTNCTIYTWPLPPCAKCSSKIIQTGINTVVSVKPSKDILERWSDDLALARSILNEAGINILYF